ncbi:MAG: hypothetical protein Q7S78_02230 [Candidatus Azambacteria bacterium]|nr:hypothetical protein [Candidatus Azambacteria bacterium]
MIAMMSPDFEHSAPESAEQIAAIERILAELSEPAGLDAADRRIGEIAPQLQSTLDKALSAGGWFDDAHEALILTAATTPDDQARIDAVRNLVLEQTRLGMLVGVAVGWEIGERLAVGPSAGSDRKGSAQDSVAPDRDDRADEV